MGGESKEEMRGRKELFFILFFILTDVLFAQGSFSGDKGSSGVSAIPNISLPQNKKDSTSNWTNSLITRLNLSQAGFSNWKSGGENSFTWVGIIEGKYIYRDSIVDWRTQHKFSYGQNKQGSNSFRKNEDIIDFSSVFSYLLGLKIDPYFSITLRTQFDKGYTYSGDKATEISNFFDPGYVTQNVGFQYVYNTKFDIRMGFSVKETYTRKFTKYSDDPKTSDIEKVRVQPGAELVSNYNNKFDDKLNLKSKFELFSDFVSFNRIDLRWDTYISYKVYKFIELSFNYVMYYNFDESSQFQWKEIAAIGLTYEIF